MIYVNRPLKSGKGWGQFQARKGTLRRVLCYNRLVDTSDSAASVGPTDPAERGRAARQAHRYPEALAEFSRALGAQPGDPLLLYERGQTYAQLARFGEAVADFTRSLELRPDQPDVLAERGAAFASLQRYPQALADFTRALALRP